MVQVKQISEVQAEILRQLLIDGRKNAREIAQATGLSEKVVERNYRKMEKTGIITGATIHINYKLFGYKAVADMLINVYFRQSDQLIEYLRKMPETYSVTNRDIEGNISAVFILKTLEQLNEVKDSIRRNFSVLEMKTAIWTEVREMHYNLAITEKNRKKNEGPIIAATNTVKNKNQCIDMIDQKIADQLAENGRISMKSLGKKIGISPQAAKRRYERLKDIGALKVTIQVNPNRIGYRALCIFFILISDGKLDLIIDKISEIRDIISIMKTTGDYDLQVYAMVQDLNRLLSIQEEIGKIQGITKADIELLRFDEKWTQWPTPRQYISTF
ncbi:MAG: AsnC family transcriptional regulator [Candidatus Bathyarchaeota archaeon]|nr:AsnC family transcriptional regulator [Candidatus Bathyarchaeota archaeon]